MMVLTSPVLCPPMTLRTRCNESGARCNDEVSEKQKYNARLVDFYVWSSGKTDSSRDLREPIDGKKLV